MPELEMSGISMIMQWKPYLMTVQGNGFSYTNSRVSLTRKYGEVTSIMKLITLSRGTWL
jgi:hypothetical protein